MNTKFNKVILLATVISIGSPYLVGRAYAEKNPQTDCDLRGMEMVQAGLAKGTSPNEDVSVISETTLRGSQPSPDNPARHGVDGWHGRFKLMTGQDEHGRYQKIIEITCDINTNRTAQKSQQINGKEFDESPIFDRTNPTPIPNRLRSR